MIHSDSQLGVSTREMAKLNDALGSKQSEHAGQEWVRKAEINALKSQIAENAHASPALEAPGSSSSAVF